MASVLTWVLAQEVPPAPPTPQWTGYTAAFLLMAAVGIASLLGSKRGHRD